MDLIGTLGKLLVSGAMSKGGAGGLGSLLGAAGQTGSLGDLLGSLAGGKPGDAGGLGDLLGNLTSGQAGGAGGLGDLLGAAIGQQRKQTTWISLQRGSISRSKPAISYTLNLVHHSYIANHESGDGIEPTSV